MESEIGVTTHVITVVSVEGMGHRLPETIHPLFLKSFKKTVVGPKDRMTELVLRGFSGKIGNMLFGRPNYRLHLWTKFPNPPYFTEVNYERFTYAMDNV